MSRTSIRIAGSSGSGLVATGDIFLKSLKEMGFYINSDREYPSLIKGGFANLQMDFGPEPLHALSTQTDLVMAVDRVGFLEGLPLVKDGGILIHGDERHEMRPDLLDAAAQRNVHLVYLPQREIVESLGGSLLMTNMVMLGLTWRVLGWDLDALKHQVELRFASKPKLLELDLKCLEAGHAAEGIADLPCLEVHVPASVPETIILNGNEAVALGAIHGGVRAYYAYPMSPSSSILTYLAATSHETGMLVKQAEDEITAAQMSIGSMHMGTRSMVATSGGGFDLMTETVSLAGITETPLVICICQRPGPGTGLPTWTGQGDLNLATYAGHGEFPRVVVAAGDQESAFRLTQQALNFAEEFQTFVALLSEKVVCETKTTVPVFEQNAIPIRRGLVGADELAQIESSDERYAITDSGVSKRWLPGQSEHIYYANSDEHLPDGRLTEDAEPARAMYAKRMRKLEAIRAALPDPLLYGPPQADISFVGWGSSLAVMRDVIKHFEENNGPSVNYLHIEFVWPLKHEPIERFFADNPQVCLIEGNYLGQLGNLVEAELDVKFAERFLKYDGRAFYVEEVIDFIRRRTRDELAFN